MTVDAFGDLLRRHRHARRLTQAELAEQAGLSERAISDLERGLKVPQRATVHLLLEALDLAPDAVESFEVAARSRLQTLEQTADSTVRHNLPAALTSFVGREGEIVRLRQLLDPLAQHAQTVRLVTLTGAGGCGKTRLAVEVARSMLGSFPDGVWFADLSSVADPTLVATVALAAIGGESSDHTPMETLLRRVRERKLLLVLDTCEHLIETCAELVEALVSTTPDLRVLATSREVLRVPVEIAWRVPSLAVPAPTLRADADQLLEYAAVELLVDRLLQVDPEFSQHVSRLFCAQGEDPMEAIVTVRARQYLSNSESEAGPDAVRHVRVAERTAQSVLRTPAGAVSWHHQRRVHRAEIGAHPIDQRFVQRSIQMKAAEESVHTGFAGQCQCVARDIDDAGVSATSEDDQAAIAHVHDDRLVIENEWIRLPVVIVPGLLYWKTGFVPGGARYFAGYQDGPLEEETRLAVLDDFESSALQSPSASRRDFAYHTPWKLQSSAVPEIRMDQDREICRAETADEPVQSAGVIEVSVAADNRLHVTRVDLQAVHVCDHATWTHARIEQHTA